MCCGVFKILKNSPYGFTGNEKAPFSCGRIAFLVARRGSFLNPFFTDLRLLASSWFTAISAFTFPETPEIKVLKP